MNDNSTGRVVCDIAVSVDGYVAGPNQTEEKVFGDGPVEELHAWFSDDENSAEVDQIVAAGAYVMGRNMFGPIRGEWDGDWRGWWGEDPPYHGPVFVLTHHPRDPVPMEGGTTFTFVTDGIESALDQARAAAGDQDVAIAGGAATVNQYLAAGLLDELRLHVAPVVLGAGERLFDGVSGLTLKQVAVRPASRVTHITYQLGKVIAPAGRTRSRRQPYPGGAPAFNRPANIEHQSRMPRTCPEHRSSTVMSGPSPAITEARRTPGKHLPS